jgi:hypothetical protein
MKPFCLLSLLLLLLLGCREEAPQPATDPEIVAPLVALNYDASNADAPALPGDSYEGAVRFSAADLQPWPEGELVSVFFYLQDLPSNCNVVVYQGTENGAPQTLVYTAGVSRQVQANSWNEHVLSNPVSLGDEDLWIGIRFSHSGNQRTLGCDLGPAAPDGDWMYSTSDQQWIPLNERAPAIDINWNIRSVVDPG